MRSVGLVETGCGRMQGVHPISHQRVMFDSFSTEKEILKIAALPRLKQTQREAPPKFGSIFSQRGSNASFGLWPCLARETGSPPASATTTSD